MAVATLTHLRAGKRNKNALYGLSKSGIVYRFATPVPRDKMESFAARIDAGGKRINTSFWVKAAVGGAA